MIIERIGGTPKLVAGGEGHTLIIGQTGATKTMAIERIVEEYHKKNYIIVYIENSKAKLEAGFCAFKPSITARYQLDLLRLQGEKPSKKEIKIYHLNNNIPTFKKIPELNIWTIDIKKLDRMLTSFLFENNSETSTLNILNNAIKRLKKDEGFFDLILNIKKSGLKKKKDLFSMEASASSINLNTILNFLGRFKDSPIIMPENYPYNLDITCLNDSKPIHIFSNRYIADLKIRDLSTLYLLNEIRKAKATGKIKKETIIVLDEIRILASQNPVYDFQKVLSKLLAELLSVCRSLGITILSASQLYGEIDSGVRQSFSNILLGKTSALNDLQNISYITGMDVDARQEILRLEKNDFMFLGHDLGLEGPWRFHLPTHAHAERNQNFDRLFSKEYPNKMKSYGEEVKSIKNDYQQQEKRVIDTLYKEKKEKGGSNAHI